MPLFSVLLTDLKYFVKLTPPWLSEGPDHIPHKEGDLTPQAAYTTYLGLHVKCPIFLSNFSQI
jgi:hypothetical protein